MTPSEPDPVEPASLEWQRIFPDADHRWGMGLRPGDLREFFRPRDASGKTLSERNNWLVEAPQHYAAMLPVAESALRETVELARSLGDVVPDEPAAWDQLLALGRAWESDFVWMTPQEDSTWCLAGGVVCFPSSWSMPEKLGQPMREIHAPVPGLNTALERQIDTFLTRMQPRQAWLRENAGFSRDSEKNHLPSRTRSALDATVQRDELFIRVEEQLLYKLPQSGAILFGIRVAVVPFVALQENVEVCSRLRRMLRTISQDAARYKGLGEAREAILSLLP